MSAVFYIGMGATVLALLSALSGSVLLALILGIPGALLVFYSILKGN